ncbi:MAG: histidinol dehydrogenase, partial [Candidatus Geothermincolia bacterium]
MRTVRSSDHPDLGSVFRELHWKVADHGAPQVAPIIDAVREEGDAALYRFTAEFDGCDLRASGLRVSQAELDAGAARARPGLAEALRTLARHLTFFHKQQAVESWFRETEEGMRVGQVIRPISRIGLYVPGGRAAYPSTVLMGVIPAKVAGVERIAACVPPDSDGSINPNTLLALREMKVTEVYKVGGAQAIAAMAFGTESIAAVDKIVGPGNAYVVAAKRELFGTVG